MKRKIIALLKKQNGRKTADIAEVLKITDYQARYYLLKMEEEGEVYRTPLQRGKFTYWYAKTFCCDCNLPDGT
ncbi:pilus assembly protein [Escherichia coli]|uniref:Pilus assembly protein n=1 Tax=Escherichia coli TaxID=562 RepID=A0A7A7A4D9_ECOLX|nr:FaeA/PapI family transcriptional regulator [Escherichia coli]EFA4518115.1 pilus assembly protein [Escherichia coli]EFN9649405.1 pilus assembly protein [Escherichia coli]EFN9723523.1 pilus assembly protein [Escherichia coli]EFN9733686.1 pilus assembly protein [Escherichia coli]EFN9743422.1 pilus assembly protein [Escherichia coli]